MSDYNPKGAPFTGRKFLLVMLGFFGVIIAVNVLMATLAVKNFHGVIVDSGYVASQDFNDDAARLKAQRERGWEVVAAETAEGVEVAFTGPDGAALEGLVVTAKALRMTDARLDRPLAFTEAEPGVYRARAALQPGKWRIALIAEGVGPRWAETRELRIGAK